MLGAASKALPTGGTVKAASGGVRTLLRLEGLAVLAGAAWAYGACAGHGWGLFALLFLAPDLSLFGYLAGPRAGARVYNAAHTYLGPLILACVGAYWSGTAAVDLALIWAAHIGMDRAIGYGLKYPDNFNDTHLGAIGRGLP
jgi:hypothetical protein